MKHKTFLTVTVIALGVCSTVLVLKAHRSDSSLPASKDSQRPPPSVARIGAVLNLPQLTSEADVIVVGKVLDLSLTSKQDQNPGKSYIASVRVDRVLKGSVGLSTITLSFVRDPYGATTGRTIAPPLYAMFFLSEKSRNMYVLADPAFQSVVATEGAPTSSGNVLDQVVNEVAHVLVSPNNSPQDQLQAVAALSSVDSPVANEALHQALASKDEKVKLEAEAGLLSHNDVSVLEQVEYTLMKLPTDIYDNRVLRLSSGIERGIRGPQAIPILARLLAAPNARVRHAAAYALRETHVVAAIGPLSKALNDSDQMVRYNAVLGLSEITGDLTHAPSVDLFKQNEKEYLTYWKQRVR